jgi:hypothetical protein
MMGNPFGDYRTDMLILLIGENPLPNYVAARLLADTSTRLLLVHSGGTRNQRDRLKKVLQAKEYTVGPNDTVEVEESNPANIRNEITSKIKGHTGSIGLNYTGGTKAMSVHAYRAVEKAEGPQERYYSYLDARSLSMVFIHHATPIPVGTHECARVSLEELLELHGLGERNRKMQGSEALIWPHTTQALADLHTASEEQQKAWRKWCNETLRDPDRDYDLRKKPDLRKQTTEHIPCKTLLPALQEDTGLTLPTSLDGLMKINKDAAKWLDGQWLEEYVFRQVEPLCQSMSINDLKMTINPKIGDGTSDFEFDVGFMRGYQFFGLSCTTEEGAERGRYSTLKSKLFEVSVRAEQLGGGEAQFALVCCANLERVKKLKGEMEGLPGAKRLRVFGRDDLQNLQAELKKWIKEASAA